MDGIQAGEDFKKITALVTGLLMAIARGLSLPWLMVLHHKLGERVVTFKLLVWCQLCLAPASMLIGAQGAGGISNVLFIAWLCQKAGVWHRRSQNTQWYSRCL
ncbi:MAG: hypothetical protein AAF085_17585, partial [Planctomycetota bacterium]